MLSPLKSSLLSLKCSSSLASERGLCNLEEELLLGWSTLFPLISLIFFFLCLGFKVSLLLPLLLLTPLVIFVGFDFFLTSSNLKSGGKLCSLMACSCLSGGDQDTFAHVGRKHWYDGFRSDITAKNESWLSWM